MFPISIDGLIVVGSMVLVDRRRRRLPASGWAWVAVVFGVGASLAANMAGAADTLTAVLIAAAAPLAFGICFELLLVQLRSRRAGRTQTVLPTPDGLDRLVPPSGAGPIQGFIERTAPATGPITPDGSVAREQRPEPVRPSGPVSVVESAPHPAAPTGGDQAGAQGGSTRPVSHLFSETHVYRLFDAAGRLLRVGVTTFVPQRLDQYRQGKDWWPDVDRVEVETYATRSEALAVTTSGTPSEFNVRGAVMIRHNPPVGPPVEIEPYIGPHDQVLAQILEAQTNGRILRTHPMQQLGNGTVLVITELRPATDPAPDTEQAPAGSPLHSQLS